MYHCFGCGASGNVYSFIMQKENYNFPDAIKLLADRAHYTLPESDYSAEMKQRAETKKDLLQIHTSAARFFYEGLQAADGQKAADYLDQRGVAAGARRKFGLGWSSYQRSMLGHLQAEGYDLALILKSGLVIPDKRGGYFDRFTNRLMFPIFNVQGGVVGFGGRILDKGEPKYLNSPETPIFDKSRNLYGINYARQAKAREILVVEGYMDVIALYQAGIHNVVASLGTAFNAEHAKLLGKYCENVVLLFDSDAAGEKAALRAIPILVANGFKPKLLQVRDAKDPDEYVKKFGKDAFLGLVSGAVNYVAFQISCAQKKTDLSDPLQKGAFLNDAAKMIAEVPNAIERDIHLRGAAEATGVSLEAIKQEVDKLVDTEAPPDTSYKNKPSFPSKKDGGKGVDEARRNILATIAADSVAAGKVRKQLKSEELLNPFYIKLYDAIYDSYDKKQRVFEADVVSRFEDPEDQKKAARIFMVKFDYTDKNSLVKALNDQIKLIKSTYIDDKIANVADLSELQELAKNKRNLIDSYITDLDG
jgi:DNA primase